MKDTVIWNTEQGLALSETDVARARTFCASASATAFEIS